ncbi:MAG: acyl-CoA synthetase [Burkholderiales bacterium]
MKARMNGIWLAQPERGSRFAMELIAWITLNLGHAAGRVLLTPICLYFVLFSRTARSASRSYLARVLRRKAGFREVFRHYHTFAATVHDRVYLLSGRLDQFEIKVKGENALTVALSRGRGCVLLGSHLGSFDVLRALGARKYAISVVMHETGNVNLVLKRLNSQFEPRVIPPGKPETLLQVKECLERNEIVGMLGDRTFANGETSECNFLGSPARFPYGPFKVAAILNVPVVLFFGLYRGEQRYEVVFEPFADRIESGSLDSFIGRYVARLEHTAREAPYNWFNFYDFWDR